MIVGSSRTLIWAFPLAPRPIDLKAYRRWNSVNDDAMICCSSAKPTPEPNGSVCCEGARAE
eukprot:CAMPEP_0181246890 /NCGR_PEP_ID=MMETSP1096-20121128/44277_1 /TAXON_ID=156174 ORGANISM="Chrysochromulina ericina, Strain CCMP281" /NCGR_SAMPLE_ID=MMETSP1096 /ASSEMBLY_ACC=CAM_ASM_000453 /LENGTH=60 /DNA_ID=CAMNT_0023343821 /DNA_START=83 /DNA_END=262 /DNA_ORIENTATION=+